MNRLIPLLFVLMLVGCTSKSPVLTNLAVNLQAQEGGAYPPGTAVTLVGRDLRPTSEVINYDLKGNAKRLPNNREPHLLVVERLQKGLTSQGLAISASAPIQVELSIEQLLVTVTRPNILYKARADSRLVLKVERQGTNLSRTFTRESTQETLGRPKVAELEEMLSGQLSDIVNQILADTAIRNMIITEQ